MRRIAVLDAPSNLGLRPPTPTSVPGCAKAPGALRDHGLLTKLAARDAGCLTPPRYDPGDWRPGDGVAHAAEIAAYSRALADRIGAIIDGGEFPVVLGGDCSILIGSGLAMHRLGEAVGGRIGLVFVDGHSDFRHPGNASYVGAAAGEDLALVTGRGQANLAAIESRRPYFRDVDVVVLGIRAQDEYRLDLQAAGIVTRPVPMLRAEGAARSAQWARDQLVDCAGYWVHVDVDVLDPAVMPAVDAPDPGGIAFPELELLLTGLVDSPHCLGVEITVFDPDYDPDGRYAAEITSAVVSGLAPVRTVTPRPDLIAARRDLATSPAARLAGASAPRTPFAPRVTPPPPAAPEPAAPTDPANLAPNAPTDPTDLAPNATTDPVDSASNATTALLLPVPNEVVETPDAAPAGYAEPVDAVPRDGVEPPVDVAPNGVAPNGIVETPAESSPNGIAGTLASTPVADEGSQTEESPTEPPIADLADDDQDAGFAPIESDSLTATDASSAPDATPEAAESPAEPATDESAPELDPQLAADEVEADFEPESESDFAQAEPELAANDFVADDLVEAEPTAEAPENEPDSPEPDPEPNRQPDPEPNGQVIPVTAAASEVRLLSRPLGSAPLLDSEPLPATRPGMLRPRPPADPPAAGAFTLHRPPFGQPPPDVA